MTAFDILLIAGGVCIGVWGLAVLLNVGGLAERYGRNGWELRQRGYQPGTTALSRMITPSTTAGARRLGAGLVILGFFGALATLSE